MRLELDCQGIKWCKNEGVICSEGVKWCKSELVLFSEGSKMM